MQHKTPLARWMRAATPAQRDALKAQLGSTASYLKHLAAGTRGASAATALRIAAAMREVPGIAPLAASDLCGALAGLVPAQGGAQ